MQTHPFTAPLVPHPDFPPQTLIGIEAKIIGLDENWLRLRWRLENSSDVVFPAFSGKGRADELWKTTCFELFLRQPGKSVYIELNLSPSERWAAYEFEAYRQDMTDMEMPREPDCTTRQGSRFTIFDASIPVGSLPPVPWEFGMSAVIEETGGHKSYWAVKHGEGKPDFHHPSCFAGRLASPIHS